MQFTIYKDNGGQFHWRLVGDDGTEVGSLLRASALATTHSAPRPTYGSTPQPPPAWSAEPPA